MSTRARTFLAFAALGVGVAAISAFVPLSYDEGNWLADVHRWSNGESLYRDIPENKTPLLLALVRGLDVLPGSFTFVRAVYLGIVAVALALAVRSIARRLGVGPSRADALGLVLGAAGALQAVFTVNFELPAATLVIAGLAMIASGSGLAGGAIAAVATGFDIRALALLPGVAWFAAPVRRRVTASMVPLAVAWFVAVLAVSHLRYGLVELNVATRTATTSWSLLDTLYAVARGALFPFGATLALSGSIRHARHRSAGIALIVGGAVVALASLQPFEKYWTLVLPGLVVVAASSGEAPSRDRRMARLVVAALLGLGLAAAYAIGSNIDQAKLVARYERVTTYLDATLADGDTVVRFDTQPFLGAFSPHLDRSPVSVLDFAVAETSRRDEIFARFEAAIAGATALVDDGALSAAESAVFPPYRPLWRVFRPYLGDFPCVRFVDGLTIRYRESACPAGTAPP